MESSLSGTKNPYLTVTIEQDAPARWYQRYFAQAVVVALRPMKNGCLRMSLPDRSEHCFGHPGSEPEARVKVTRWDFFRKCVLHGDVGFGEAYQAGDWETDDLTRVIGWFCANTAAAPTMSGSQKKSAQVQLLGAINRMRHLLRRNSRRGARDNIQAHYDLGNRFYSLWLDPSMTYSSGIFSRPEEDLEQAQFNKYDRLCQQLRLQAEDEVLEIGCGWGGFAAHAIKHYGCRVTGLTISPEQHRYARDRMQLEGIANRAEILLLDYRDLPTLNRRFEKIVSIEMLEAVGAEYLPTFVDVCSQVIKPQGIFAAQFITVPDCRYNELRRGVDWIQKHIFPGSLLISLNRFSQLAEKKAGWHLHDLRDIGLDYSATLRAWRERFFERIEEVRGQGFDDRFIRSWHYYLAYCEAAFAWRNIGVVQAIYTAPNNPNLMG